MARKATFSSFVKNYNYPKLARAVISQMNCTMAEASEELSESSFRSADQGVTGFIYYNQTMGFYKKNRKAIIEALEDDADAFGEDLIPMIKGFNCLKGDVTSKEVSNTLYGTPKQMDTYVANALAWYALEKVAFDFQNYAYDGMNGCGGRKGKGKGLGGIKNGTANYTKKDLVERVAKYSGISQKSAEKLVGATLQAITYMTSSPKACLTISKFGSFRTKEYHYNTKGLDGKRYSGTRKKLAFTPSKAK